MKLHSFRPFGLTMLTNIYNTRSQTGPYISRRSTGLMDFTFTWIKWATGFVYVFILGKAMSPGCPVMKQQASEISVMI